MFTDCFVSVPFVETANSSRPSSYSSSSSRPGLARTNSEGFTAPIAGSLPYFTTRYSFYLAQKQQIHMQHMEKLQQQKEQQEQRSSSSTSSST